MSSTYFETVSNTGLVKTIFFGLSLSLLSSCGSVAKFTDQPPVTLHPGKELSAELQVSNWSDDKSLTIINGGPYLENSILFPVDNKYLDKLDNHVVSVDINNDLHILDFNVKPAKKIFGVSLGNEVTAIATFENHVFIGFKDTGLMRLTISAEKKSVKKEIISSAPHITQIKVSKGIVYYLTENKKITSFSPARTAENNSASSSWKLPDSCHDFAVTDDFFVLLTDNGIGIIDRTAPENFVSTFKLQGTKQQLSLWDTTAIVADGNGGMVMVDINDPGNPRWLGSHNKLGSIDKILWTDKKAFVIDRGVRLASINTSRVELPVTESFYKPDGQIHDAILAEHGVYIATSTGIEKISFPEASHAQISNEGINQGGTRRAFIAENLAYVADWFSGLHIYDISNPASPRHIGNLHTPGSSKGVVVENGYAYVGDDDHGLQIIDVKNPEKPFAVGSIQTTGLAYTLKKRGDLIFLADHRGGFHIINVADVTKPFIVASHNTAGKSWAIDVKDNLVFVADDNSGLLVFDISDIRQPVQIGQFDIGGYAEDVVIQNNIAYVSFFDKGLYVVDVSKPQKPAEISHIAIPGNARSVVLKDQYVYVAGWESGLHIVNISNPELPVISGSFDTRGSAWGADVSGNYAYVWDWWGGVKVIDVSNPERPTLSAQYHANSRINTLRQKNSFIYTANHAAGIQVFDINNALNPIWSTGIDIEGHILDVWPSQHSDTLYAVGDQAGLVVCDIKDPFYISRISSQKIEGIAKFVREYGSKVYVATQNGELHIFNAANPAQPKLSQTLTIDARDLWVDRQTVFVASASEGLVTFSINQNGQVNPKKQVISESTHKVVASEKYLVAATDNQEVHIWRRPLEGITPLTTININDNILSLALHNDTLLVLSKRSGLLQYAIGSRGTRSNAAPSRVARYPLTDHYNDMLIHDDAVFFSGQDTIASVQLLPTLSWTAVDNTKLRVSINGDLALGNYHLAITDAKGNESLWPNALSMTLKKSGKPKLSIDDFQKLLEQHRKNQ